MFMFLHLNNYFNLYVLRLSVLEVACACHTSEFPIPAVVSQNVNHESCLAYVKSEKYVVWVILRPLGSKRQGEAELHTLQY